MVIQDEAFHGSDLERIAQRYQIDISSIIPFASNVNPYGISPKAKQAIIDNIEAISAYPDRNYTFLKNSISKYCEISPEQLVLGNGTSELITQVFKAIQPKNTVILGPTYSEYKRSANAIGSCVEMYSLMPENDFQLEMNSFLSAIHSGIDLVIICNPNNPTSTALSKNEMTHILEHCAQQNTIVLVDETYVEFVQDLTLISCVSLTQTYNNLIVLRGVSKFFASPGLRLGYAITTNERFLEATNQSKVPWNINAYASIAGVMFNDKDYIRHTKTLMQTERSLIYSALSTRKTIKVFKPTANFILIQLRKEELTASTVFEHCIKNGLMIRDCTDYEGLGEKYIRFCFMKPEQNDIIVNTLLDIV